METAVVQVPRGFLYEEPQYVDHKGSYYKVADEIFMGWAVGILEEKGNVCQVVTHHGYKGYMDAAQLIKIPAGKLKERDEREEICYLQAGLTDVMDVPKVEGRVIVSLTRGSLVEPLLEKEGGYQRVRLSDGQEGYVPEKSLKKRLDTDRYLYEEGWNFHTQSLPGNMDPEAFRRQVTDTARSYLGTQYRWGGKSAQGIDCSGTAFMSYFLNGILIYRDASIREEYPIKEIPIENLKPADLLFFPGHVAMYLGEGKYIHSTAYRESFGCVINSLNPGDGDYREDLKEKLTAAGRLELLMEE